MYQLTILLILLAWLADRLPVDGSPQVGRRNMLLVEAASIPAALY